MSGDGERDGAPDIEAALAQLLEQLEAEPNLRNEELLSAAPEPLRAKLDQRLTSLRQTGLLPSGSQVKPGALLLDRFELEVVVGEGGMGRVFSAFDRHLGRQVAIKVLRRFDANSPRRERFLNEARVSARLEHPAILGLHELLELPSGEPLLIMPLVGGKSLSETMERDPAALSTRRRVEIVRRVAEALAYAHEQGVLHRDLKPSNVMIGSHGEVLLMDWGLARIRGVDELASDVSPLDPKSPESPTMSRTGDRLGTPGYMAPEQERGEPRAIDERTDVYGLGALLRRVLSDWRPHSSQREADHPEPQGAGKPSMPAELDAISSRCLAADPDNRYPSVNAVLSDLEAFLEDRQGEAWRDGLLVRTAKAARRHPLVASAAIAVPLIALLAVLLVKVGDDLRRERMDMKVQRQELQRKQQAEDDQLAIGELRRLQEAWIGPKRSAPYKERELDSSRRLVSGLAQHGLDLAAASPEELLAKLVETADRNPLLAEQMEYALHELAYHIINARVPAVPGTLSVPQSDGEDAGIAGATTDPWFNWIAAENLWAVPTWNALLPTLDQLNIDPWRHDIWLRLKELWLKRSPHIEPFDIDSVVKNRSGPDVILAARAWHSELVRKNGLSRTDADHRMRDLVRGATVSDPSSYRAQYKVALLDDLVQDRAALPLAHNVLALAHATAANALRPESYQALHQRAISLAELAAAFGRLAGQLNDEEKAAAAEVAASEFTKLSRDVYLRCLELQPDDIGTLCNYSRAVADTHPDEAFQVLERAYSLQPDDPHVLESYSDFVADKLGQPGSPLDLEILQRWAAATPDNWQPYQYLLGTLFSQGRLDEARSLVGEWREAVPSLPQTRHGVQRNLGPVESRLARIAELLGQEPAVASELLTRALRD